MTDFEPDASNETGTRAPIRDSWFNPWLYARGDGLRSLVQAFLSGVQFHERTTEARERARRSSDQEIYKTVVDALVTNLALTCFNPQQTGRIAISLRKGDGRSRYDNPALSTRVLRDVLDKLRQLEAISFHRGRRGVTTTIAPTQWFKNRIADHKAFIDDIGVSEQEEIIILKRKRRGPGDEWSFENRATWEDYKDNAYTRASRDELRDLNRFIEQADISFDDDGELPPVNTKERTLRRYFSVFPDQPVTFDQVGRLFGGWWLNLKSARRAHILIEGEHPIILDYASMFGRLAYAHMGLQAPEGDLYDLTELLDGYRRDVKSHRSGVKKVFNAMLFGGAMGNRLPKGARAELPSNATVGEVRRAVIARNPALEPLFGTAVGYKLMFLESQVLMAVLKQLMAKNSVALPLHDGLMVGATKEGEATEAMMLGAKSVIGFHLPVERKAVTSFHLEFLGVS